MGERISEHLRVEPQAAREHDAHFLEVLETVRNKLRSDEPLSKDEKEFVCFAINFAFHIGEDE